MFRIRSSQTFFKIIVLKKFVNFTEKKPVSESSLIKLLALRTPTLLKRDSKTDFFCREICIIFKNTLLLYRSPAAAFAGLRFPACNFVKKETRAKMFFSVSFTKSLRTSFDRTPSDDCSLCLSENFEKFFRTPLL